MPSCAVKWCGKDSGRFSKKKDNITFHRFPQNSSTKSRWTEATKRENWSPSSTSVICSRHFTSDCFYPTKTHRRLIEGSIPTLYLPVLADNADQLPYQEEPTLNLFHATNNSKSPQGNTESAATIQKRLENRIKDLTAKLADKKQKIKRLHSRTRYLNKKVELMKHIIRQSVQNSDEGVTSKDLAIRVKRKLSEANKECIFKHKRDKRIRENDKLETDVDLTAKPKNVTNGKSGFTSEVLQDLKNLAKDIGTQLVCTLIVDEIDFKDKVAYDNNVKRTHLNDDDPAHIEETSEAIVFLISAINYDLHAPIGYFLTNKISCNRKMELIQEALGMCHSYNVTVKCLTFVGSAKNISIATQLGCNFDPSNLKGSFKHPKTNEDVFIILDVVHLRNMVVNALDYFKVMFDGDGHVVDWTLIDKLRRFSVNEIESVQNNVGDSLKKIKFESEVTRLTSDVLFNVGTVIKWKKYRNAGSTARILNVLQNLFDILDSRCYSGLKGALNDSNHLKIFKSLRECKNLLMSIKTKPYPDRGDVQIRLIDSPRRTGFVGFCITLESYRNIYYDIERNRNCYIPYLSFQKLCHDPMKMFISNFKNYCNGKPTVRNFECFYKEMLARNRSHDSKTYCAYIRFNNTFSSPLDRINLRFQRSQMESIDNQGNVLDELKCGFLNCSIVPFAKIVCQTLVKQIHCFYCLTALISFDCARCSFRCSNCFAFKSLRIYPSGNVIRLCKLSNMYVKIFNRYYKLFNKTYIINKILSSIVDENIFSDILSHDIDHVIDLTRCVIEQYLSVSWKWDNK